MQPSVPPSGDEDDLLSELRDDDMSDPLTVLMAIVQAAVSDETFSASTVRYMLDTMGRVDLWDQAVSIAQRDPTEDLDEDEEMEDPDPEDER